LVFSQEAMRNTLAATNERLIRMSP